MQQKLVYMALLVHDYDEAIDFYTNQLNFVLQEDTQLSDTKRWVVICPPRWRTRGCFVIGQSFYPRANGAGGQPDGWACVFIFAYRRLGTRPPKSAQASNFHCKRTGRGVIWQSIGFQGFIW